MRVSEIEALRKKLGAESAFIFIAIPGSAPVAFDGSGEVSIVFDEDKSQGMARDKTNCKKCCDGLNRRPPSHRFG